MLTDGLIQLAEFNASGAVLARHAHGPAAGVDDPLVSYNGASTSVSNARFLQNDARGSIVYSSDRYDSAASRVINTYDEYGQPGAGNEGRFQYTGQVWLPELGMYYYKARIYSPALGRFMQTDPIGYEDNVNLYGYVGQDPVNGTDFTGMEEDDDLSLGNLVDSAFGERTALKLEQTFQDIRANGVSLEVPKLFTDGNLLEFSADENGVSGAISLGDESSFELNYSGSASSNSFKAESSVQVLNGAVTFEGRGEIDTTRETTIRTQQSITSRNAVVTTQAQVMAEANAQNLNIQGNTQLSVLDTFFAGVTAFFSIRNRK